MHAAESIRSPLTRRPGRARRLRAAALPLAALLPAAAARAETAEAAGGTPTVVAVEAVATAPLASPAWTPDTRPALSPATVPLAVAAGWTLTDPSAAEPLGQQPSAAPEPPAPAPYGPPDRSDSATGGADRRATLGERLGAVKWETLGLAAYLTAINLPGLIKHPSDFDFEDEGLFGDDTANLGVDKVAHAYNAYVLSDILYWRMRRKVGASPASALTASAIAVGLDIYAELYDGFERRSGFAVSDVGFNVLGAGFSFMRNSVPGLKEKVDFRLLIMPNHDLYSINNKKEHFRQERFLFALKLAGFEGLKRTPLRFLELHAGYYATGFTDRERARGDKLDQRPFVGLGINLKELLFPHSQSAVARVVRTGLTYLQVPYTAVQID